MNDKCISCGNETRFPKETSIEERNNYIIGAGQLCRVCHDKIYKMEKNLNFKGEEE